MSADRSLESQDIEKLCGHVVLTFAQTVIMVGSRSTDRLKATALPRSAVVPVQQSPLPSLDYDIWQEARVVPAPRV